ncbi:EPS-associated transcriptional regulator, MarR family [Methanoculleus chikugoensis]|uniref:EPS-associated transcriptional regulator, MarR family n=1 Tax=Methanoculleus chikugoensis TaxID=118126 RepID=A0A1M4MNT7_9EURY|nr:winged helix-turn-helix transcriptional regulator [Methanoculleus chikugoensis]MDD4566982.1 winged helix-turn-helix transcriptional regulator [Methanoculleus chikugoensis]NMA09763.1 winged helix-turn-helix transcriptional regulator [Methanomicrobiales archaeon]SCL76536.1 EPS-associated transcriptional regulator, MarR family [Methanoculleus chikugoensis]
MRRWPAAVILIILLSALPSCATAGHTVMPTGDYVPDRPPQDMTPIEWWQVPPQILITSLLIGTAPELVVVANILVLLNVWLFFGYRRIAKRAALDHETRTAIYDHIRAHPGIRLGTLAEDLGINRGTLRYHLGRLQEFGMVAATAVGGQTGYFENRQRYSELEAKVLIHLKNPNTREILFTLLEKPGASRRDLAERLGITASSVSWHLRRLRGDGVVLREKSGADVRYTLSGDSAAFVGERVGGGNTAE